MSTSIELTGASLVAQTVKNRLQCKRPEFNPWIGKIPWRRAWQSAPVFVPGESLGQRRDLKGFEGEEGAEKSGRLYSPWSCKESDMTEAT